MNEDYESKRSSIDYDLQPSITTPGQTIISLLFA